MEARNAEGCIFGIDSERNAVQRLRTRDALETGRMVRFARCAENLLICNTVKLFFYNFVFA